MEGMSNVKKTVLALALLTIVGFSCFMLGGYLHDDGNTEAEIRAIAERIERIDRDIKLEFRSLRSTITEGRRETEESRVIVGQEREARERDREIIREMQDRIRELQAISGEIERKE